jgi:DNA recombination protein RmuC
MFWIGAILFVIVILLVLKISSQTNSQLNAVTAQISERLKEMSAALQDTHKNVGQRLDSTASVIGDLKNTLGRLEKTNQQIFEVSKDISGLQNLLRAPKFRGEMGETLLGNLLEQVLPKDHYRLQHQFKTSETVDAVIRLGNNMVPVDAKFPLENFQAFLASSNEEEKNNFRKKFVADVKNRINEIASKYILPDEGTFDFALMYIPAENIYYETTIKQELLSYALSKRVIPVSPNTFYAYLQVILLGLKGMQVERNAKEILANLARMQQDVVKFSVDFKLIGKHIQDAKTKYEEADKKLDRFQDKLVVSSRSPQPSIENLVEK